MSEPQREPGAFAAPQWARDVGRWSWILIGVLGIFIVLVIVYGLVEQLPVIQENLQAAVDSIEQKLASTSVDQEALDSMKAAIGDVLQFAVTGVAGTVADVVSGLASLIFGIFIGINIMVWVPIQGRKIGLDAYERIKEAGVFGRVRGAVEGTGSEAVQDPDPVAAGSPAPAEGNLG